MKNNQILQAIDLINKNLIVKHYAGSLAYGTILPTSDVDIRGLFCADPIHIRTSFFNIKEYEIPNEEDTKFYELTNFMKLCLDCNPNIIETLWIDDSDILKTSYAYSILRYNREKLLSSKIAFTTSGYAFQQLKRIKGHNKWINNPKPVDPPKQTSYIKLVHNFTDDKMFKMNILSYKDNYRLIPYDGNLFGLYQVEGYSTFADDYSLNTLYESDGQEFLNPDGTRAKPLFIVKFNKEEYKQDHEQWKLYWKWKRERNVVRSQLEEDYGYDTKHMMHCVRLLRMGKETLETGKVIVKRPDASELLDIRAGKWSYEYLIEYAEYMDNEIKKLYKSTDLPKKPNLEYAAKLLMELQDMCWSE